MPTRTTSTARRWSTTGFLIRALRWFRARGVTIERVMTDNGSGYVDRLFRKVLRMLAIRHIRIRPCTPKTNGKAERYIQTILRELACAIPFGSSGSRPRPTQMALLVQSAKTSCWPQPTNASSGPRRNDLIRLHA